MAKREIKYIIETIEAGQRKKYGDSYYHYIIESNQSIFAIKEYCTKLLRPAISKEEYDNDSSFGGHFSPYYTSLDVLHEVGWKEDGLNKVEYKVVEPSTH